MLSFTTLFACKERYPQLDALGKKKYLYFKLQLQQSQQHLKILRTNWKDENI